jgi:hypothetical protein
VLCRKAEGAEAVATAFDPQDVARARNPRDVFATPVAPRTQDPAALTADDLAENQPPCPDDIEPLDPRGSQPSLGAILAARAGSYFAIWETAGLLESYAISLREAAWRADPITLDSTLRQMRLCLVEAIQLRNSLDEVR